MILIAVCAFCHTHSALWRKVSIVFFGARFDEEKSKSQRDTLTRYLKTKYRTVRICCLELSQNHSKLLDRRLRLQLIADYKSFKQILDFSGATATSWRI